MCLMTATVKVVHGMEDFATDRSEQHVERVLRIRNADL